MFVISSIPTMTNQISTDSTHTNDVLEYGQLIRISDKKSIPYQIKRVDISGIDEIMSIQEKTFKALDDRALYYPSSREIFEESLADNGLVIGCYVDSQLIAFRSIWYPGLREENLGNDLGMCSSEQLNQVAHLERACVLPDFRGNRLQIHMTNNAIRLAKEKRFFRYLFSTVAPSNYASMQDKFACNMIIVRLLKKYEDYYRYIFYQDIIQPIDTMNNNSVTTSFDGEDITGQLAFLSTDKKNVGFQQFKKNNSTHVNFLKIDKPLF